MPSTKKKKNKSFVLDTKMKNINSILIMKQKYNKTSKETSQKPVLKSKPKNTPTKKQKPKLKVGAKPREEEEEEEEGEEPLTLNKKEYERHMLDFNYSKVWDLEYASYKDNEEYKALVKVNPSIYSVNGAFYSKHNKSFIAALMNEENLSLIHI